MTQQRSSKKQRELLSFVDNFIKGNGYGPSYREIMRALDYKSVSTVAVHIDGLISKGFLAKSDHSARSLEVVGQPTGEPVAASQQPGLAQALTDKFDQLSQQEDPNLADLEVLVEALRVLGEDQTYQRLSLRLAKLRQPQ